MIAGHSILLLLGLLALILFAIWAAQRIIAAFGIGDPPATLIYVVIVGVCLFAILDVLGLFGSRIAC